jgi:hypothetical protein
MDNIAGVRILNMDKYGFVMKCVSDKKQVFDIIYTNNKPCHGLYANQDTYNEVMPIANEAVEFHKKIFGVFYDTKN